MKYSEAEKKIKELSSKYDIDMDDGDFNIVYSGIFEPFCVDGHEQYIIAIGDTKCFRNMPLSSKLYMILAELAMTPLDERVNEKKYFLKIFDNEFGYLNVDILTDDMMVYDGCETEFIKTKFTNKEIDELKQRDDIPFDWNKVHFKEA